jgi:diaminopimelate epimerase
MTTWRLYHYSGCGNRFLVTYDPEEVFPEHSPKIIQELCDQSTIASDGIIIVRPSTKACSKMISYNRDGSRIPFCGNGLRCAAHLINTLLLPTAHHIVIETDVGLKRATVNGNRVEVEIGHIPPEIAFSLPLPTHTVQGVFIDVGVPHAVITVPHIQTVDVATLGPSIRNHPSFAPHGTNVTFVSRSNNNRFDLCIRTYERGVERETLSCGTGAVAASIVMWPQFSQNTIRLQTKSQEILTVRRDTSTSNPWYSLLGEVACLGIIDETLPCICKTA